MGYTLPLRFIKVSPYVGVCATRIVTIMERSLHQADVIYKKEKKAQTLINACGKLVCKSIIVMDNGSVISSPYSVLVLLNAIERSNFKKSSAKRMSEKRLKVYEAFDEPPRPEIDEEVPDVTVEGGEFDTDEELEENLDLSDYMVEQDGMVQET